MNDNQISDAYRARLVDGIYNKNVSNRDLLYAKIHQQLDVNSDTDPDILDSYIQDLAITNQKLYVMDKMFMAPTESESEINSQETD